MGRGIAPGDPFQCFAEVLAVLRSRASHLAEKPWPATTGSSQNCELMPKKQVLDDEVGAAAGGGAHDAQEQNNFEHIESIDIPMVNPQAAFLPPSGHRARFHATGWQL